MNIDTYKYKLNIETCTDDMLEIFFGKDGLCFYRLIQNATPLLSNCGTIIQYVTPTGKILMEYNIASKCLWICYKIIDLLKLKLEANKLKDNIFEIILKLLNKQNSLLQFQINRIARNGNC